MLCGNVCVIVLNSAYAVSDECNDPVMHSWFYVTYHILF